MLCGGPGNEQRPRHEARGATVGMVSRMVRRYCYSDNRKGVLTEFNLAHFGLNSGML